MNLYLPKVIDPQYRLAARAVDILVNGLPLLVLWDELGCSVAEVNRVLDLFAIATITDQVRKHTLALELARLDELHEAFYDRLWVVTCSPGFGREDHRAPLHDARSLHATGHDASGGRSASSKANLDPEGP